MNKIKSGFFAVAEVTDPNGHVEYNWWHSSDHIPENLALEGVVLGTRWAAPRSYMDARLAVHPAFASSQYLVHYLMTDPLEKSYREFSDLGASTRALGRFYGPRTIHAAGHHLLVKGYVAPRIPISPEALPFRPNKGVFVVMADLVDAGRQQEITRWFDQVHMPDMLTVKGVTGAYWFQSRGQQVTGASDVGHPERRWVFVFYLDEDPLEMVADLKRRMVKWKAAGRLMDTGSSMETVLEGPWANITTPEHYDWNEQ